MPWLCCELLFSMLCMLFIDKGSSLNLDLMSISNCALIMIMLIFMCVRENSFVLFGNHNSKQMNACMNTRSILNLYFA